MQVWKKSIWVEEIDDFGKLLLVEVRLKGRDEVVCNIWGLA